MYLWSKIAEVPLMDINVIARNRLGMALKNFIYNNQKIYNSSFKKNVCLWPRLASSIFVTHKFDMSMVIKGRV